MLKLHRRLQFLLKNFMPFTAKKSITMRSYLDNQEIIRILIDINSKLLKFIGNNKK